MLNYLPIYSYRHCDNYKNITYLCNEFCLISNFWDACLACSLYINRKENVVKKLTAVALLVVSALGSVHLANATETTRVANATASWDAKAIKDTQSMLVVTPLKSLSFNYAEGLERFNSQDGAFDVTIQGQSGASDFKLTSKLVSHALSRTSDDSSLEVGVSWNGQTLSDSEETTMVDTSTGISSGLSVLADAAAFAGSDRTSTQGVFTFGIDKATVAGAETAFSELTDGYWDGNVNVEFTATWTGDFSTNGGNDDGGNDDGGNDDGGNNA